MVLTCLAMMLTVSLAELPSLATEVETEVEGVKRRLTGKELEDWKYQRYMQDYLATIQER